jgi:hypothetical protein
MARHKNANWRVPDSPTTEQAILTMLMDLRDEMKEMNNHLRVLSCPNFLRIPKTLDAIRLHTRKKRKTSSR